MLFLENLIRVLLIFNGLWSLCGQKTQTSLFPFGYSVSPPRVSPLDFTPAMSHSQLISGMMTEEDGLMDWKTLLACITGSAEEQLLLRNEYVVEPTFKESG